LIRLRLSKQRKEFEKECLFHDKEGVDGDIPEKPKEANEITKMITETQIQSSYPMKVRLMLPTHFRNSAAKHTSTERCLKGSS
jgi:hypothetical protein